MIKYQFKKTVLINKRLAEIDGLKAAFIYLRPRPHVEERFRREAILKSSLYSVRVEGNRLTLEQAENHY